MIPPAAAVAAISSWRARFSSSSWDRSFWISSKARAFATAVVTGRATSSRIRTSSGEKGDRVVRANTIAATSSSSMVSGSTTAHSAPVRVIAASSSLPSFLMSLRTIVCRSSFDGVAHRGDGSYKSSVAPVRIGDPSDVRRRSSRPLAADRCGGSPHETGPPRVRRSPRASRSTGTSPSSAPATAASTLDRSRWEFAACATARSVWYFASPDHRASIRSP